MKRCSWQPTLFVPHHLHFNLFTRRPRLKGLCFVRVLPVVVIVIVINMFKVWVIC